MLPATTRLLSFRCDAPLPLRYFLFNIEHTDRIELSVLVLQTNALPLGYVCLLASRVGIEPTTVGFGDQLATLDTFPDIRLSFQPVRPLYSTLQHLATFLSKLWRIERLIYHNLGQRADSNYMSGVEKNRTFINGFSVRHLDHVGNYTKQKSPTQCAGLNYFHETILHSPAISFSKPTEAERCICVLSHSLQNYKYCLN